MKAWPGRSIATTVRTDNASLSAVKDSLGLGSSAVDTAYNGLNSIISDLQNMRAKLQTALSPGTDRTKVQTEIAAIPPEKRVIITSHDAFGYFEHAYGLNFLAPEGVSTESEASAADVAKLVDHASEVRHQTLRASDRRAP